jgi:hypothetical protein
MSTPTGPLRPSAEALRRAGWPDPGMRVSDADRAEIADRLALHFSDGRLDQAEFDQRLDQVMQAKTRADLIGLLADLPEFDSIPPPGDPHRPRSQRRQQRQILKVQLERERLLLKHERREQRRREREYRWYSMQQLPVITLIVALAVVASIVLRHIYSIWLVIAVLGFLWLRYAHASRGPGNRGQ